MAGGWIIKLLAADSVTMRQTVKEVRRLVYQAWDVPEVDLRKI